MLTDMPEIEKDEMLFIDSPSKDPYFNLALEEYVFERMDQSRRYMILWQNENTIVIGKFQNAYAEINAPFVQEHNIKVARRLSGGGAVYHDSGNLNYTFIVNQSDNEEFDFSRYVAPVVDALQSVNIDAAFNGRNDITIDGKKFSGSSQYFKHGRLLHHGCIMLDSNIHNVTESLNVSQAKYESKVNINSVRSRVTTINENAQTPLTIPELKALMLEFIGKGTDLKEMELTAEQLDEITRLRDQKYALDDWNYGESPAFNVTKEKKFPSGMVSCYMKVDKQMIQEIRLYGDFFGNGDISDLEDIIRGQKLDESLRDVLSGCNVSFYMSQISGDDLYELIVS